MTFRQRQTIANRVPMDFRNATKQPWECSSYEEFVASLPENERDAVEANLLAAELDRLEERYCRG